MNLNFMVDQINRLRIRFGESAFDKEFCKLVQDEIKTMSEYGFKRAVDIWIGSRTRSKPPLLSEFREARLLEEKVVLDNAARLASNVLSHPAKFGGLKKYLSNNFPDCKTLADAVKERREQIRIRRIVEPDYDPMTDPAWMNPEEPA